MPSGTAEADELLLNGGFDSTSGWSGNRFAVPGTCSGRNGSAMALMPDNSNIGLAVQNVKVNGGAGPFVFSGWVKIQSGDATVRPLIRWVDAGGAEVSSTVLSAPLS